MNKQMPNIKLLPCIGQASHVALVVKNLPANAGDKEMWVQSLRWEDLLEVYMATHSHILAWRIPQTEEPGRLQSIASHRVGHNWTKLARMHYALGTILDFESKPS